MLRPKYITFDCYGTLTQFHMAAMTREMFADRISAAAMDQFCRDEQVMSNVEKLGVPFYKVFTAEQGQAYKPRLAAFEYLLDNLGCGPEDVLHVSSSFQYDLIPADHMNIQSKVFVNRGHEPNTPHYTHTEIHDMSGLQPC
jgi:FMN phosphatase YigB (HAD superfamily)